jgi:DNA modification methylase
MEADSVDLVFTSPPYEAARTYGVGFNLRGQQFVDWCVERYLECVRVCKGLVAWVIEGQTRQFRWSATPALLMADLHRAGVRLRKPPAFHRVGIPGSGGPDWLRNDYEFIICSTKGKLPWSDNTAMGHPPKWAPGGEMSYRLASGARRNQWGETVHDKKVGERDANGNRAKRLKPSHRFGERQYNGVTKANPGNVIKCNVGGGLMGSDLAHENEAPFPESLAEFFIRSFCPPGGTVLDPFCGSGTTCAVAKRLGREWIGIDIRQSMVDLTKRRLATVQMELVLS